MRTAPRLIVKERPIGKLLCGAFVFFTDECWQIAARLAKRREQEAARKSMKANVVANFSAEEAYLIGAAGECAAAWYFGQGSALEKSIMDGGKDLYVDGYSVQVRCSDPKGRIVDYASMWLYLKEHEQIRADRYLLTVRQAPYGVALLGWCRAADFLARGQEVNFGYNGFLRGIQYRNLHRMDMWNT